MMQTPLTREPEKAVAAADGPLGVERYAEVLAHIVYFKVPSRPEVLQRLGIDPSAWAAADAKWMQALVDEALEDEHPVAAAFAAAFAPVLKRLKAEKPSIDSIGTPPSPPSPPKARSAAPVLPPPAPPPVDEPPAPAVGTELPTYLLPSRPPVPARSPLAATSLALDLPIGPALPFAKSTGAEPPAPSPPTPPSPSVAGDSAAAPTLPRVQKAPAHLTGTMSVSDLPVAAVLPFAQGAAGEAPALTLEEYASLRASLTVNGEEDAATWKQFGIVSQAMKEALQARFAARFRDDAEARDRFVALLQRMVGELRAKAHGG